MTLKVQALAFDVFGTVVDWYGSIVAEVARIGLPVDGPEFALAWRAGYEPAMQEVRSGALPWTNIDGLHRRILDRLLAERGATLPQAATEDLNRIWHRLAPWPDSVAGLARLKSRYTTATLSNGNLSLLVAMARHAGLPWDAVLSAELFGHYKPDPEVYLGAARLLDLAPQQLLMVAAHPADLRAAAACGLRTAFVPRPLERGPGGALALWTEGEFDLVARDIGDLASRLGC
ncbi:MAG TPA: haloacid dehalogenase type II [Rubrivivax sp.]|nr:haloacid dehalogenase type II [Rubrivivax sp.]